LAELACSGSIRQVVMMASADPLEQTLLHLAPALAKARRPWWVIASAAVKLHTGSSMPIRDLDLLLAREDVPAVFEALGLPPTPGGSDGLFRSEVFARYEAAALPVELFAGFELFRAGQWQAILPESRELVRWGRAETYVPDASELAAMLRDFGREKDLIRAEMLSASDPFPSRS
jgi:hypothetical protein